MSKIKFATFLFLLISVSFCSCQMGRKGKFQEYYEARTAVNLSDLIKIWQDYQRASETDFPINLDEALGIRTFLADGNMLVGESNHFIKLPQYKQSSHPHDKFAMMAATELAATPNLSRFGRLFGNEAFDEMVKLLPKRIYDPDEEQGESEPEEPKFNFNKQQTGKKK